MLVHKVIHSDIHRTIHSHGRCPSYVDVKAETSFTAGRTTPEQLQVHPSCRNTVWHAPGSAPTSTRWWSPRDNRAQGAAAVVTARPYATKPRTKPGTLLAVGRPITPGLPPCGADYARRLPGIRIVACRTAPHSSPWRRAGGRDARLLHRSPANRESYTTPSPRPQHHAQVSVGR
jgi:hypothetical protein